MKTWFLKYRALLYVRASDVMQSFQLKGSQAYLVPKIIELSSSPRSRECPLLEFSIFKEKEPHQLIGNSKTGGNQIALPLALQEDLAVVGESSSVL